jgi:hypothetical protein
MRGPAAIEAEPVFVRTPPRSVTLFLADGIPSGVVIATVGNWNGQVLTAPRGRLSELLHRTEASRTGVYVLFGPDPDRVDGILAYIGEADDIAARLRIHLRTETKDFFDRLAFVVSTDGSLTKGHIRYLEGRLIRLTREAGSVTLTNDTHPDFQRLPEAAKADMDTFIEQLKLVLPLVGFDLFRRTTLTPRSPLTGAASGEVVFTFSTGGASATARETDEGFVVLAGSTARKGQSGTFPAGYFALRSKLLADGSLVDASEFYRFATDVTFSSPSAAASIVAARSASGPLEWRPVGSGQTYRDWRSMKLA